MSNKQSMKLYTEEQVKMAIQMADKYNYLITLEECGILNQLTPIELPSDSICINCDESKSTHNICMDCIIKVGKENIELPSDEDAGVIALNIADNLKDKLTAEQEAYFIAGFQTYPKWMRDKIQGGNK